MRNSQLNFRLALFAFGFCASFVPLTTAFLLTARQAPQADIVLRLQITPPGQAI